MGWIPLLLIRLAPWLTGFVLASACAEAAPPDEHEARLARMADNASFLEAMVLQLARELRFDRAEKHFVEVLLEGEGAPRVREAVKWMPDRVEEFVASGRWRPRDLKEWKWLSVIALWGNLQEQMPKSLELAMALENSPARYIGAGLLFTPNRLLGDILQQGFRHGDSNNRAYSALAVSANGFEDYAGALRVLLDDPDPWPRANAIASLIRLGDARGGQEARALFDAPASPSRAEAVSYLLTALSRAAPHPSVLQFLAGIQGPLQGQLQGADRAAVDAILVLHGAQTDTSRIRAELPKLDSVSFELQRGVRALAKMRKPEDVAVLAQIFHRSNTPTVALELAVALARAGSNEAEPLLRNAAFALPWSQVLLAAGAARALYGDPLLIRWLEIAPATTPSEVFRRIGYALGEFGGPRAVALLRERASLEGDAGLPGRRTTAALQGAMLGLLSAEPPR